MVRGMRTSWGKDSSGGTWRQLRAPRPPDLNVEPPRRSLSRPARSSLVHRALGRSLLTGAEAERTILAHGPASLRGPTRGAVGHGAGGRGAVVAGGLCDAGRRN